MNNVVTKIRISEIFMRGHPLGRHVEHDVRSRNYDFRSISPEGFQDTYTIHDSVWPATSLPLNQLQVGKCTAEALCGALDCAPDYTGRTFTDVDSDQLYRQETADEGYPWPTYDPGGSGLAVCKAAKELGWIHHYRHTFSLNHALHALNHRPGMFGLNWYDSFDKPDINGLISISPNAVVRGGHEVLAVQVEVANQLVVFWNSWGPSWGEGGQFAMSWDTLDRLLSEQGDFTVPIP